MLGRGHIHAIIRNAIATRERLDILPQLGFARPTAEKILAQGVAEEGRPAETSWDFAQAITAWARRLPYQDARVSVEQTAGRLLQPLAG